MKLAEAGLCDVAFHVDTTQKRSGYQNEQQLNQLRQTYLEAAKDLGLMVVFNTTVHAGNINEIPELIRFFCSNADAIGLVSFQLQAETGRGEWGTREDVVNKENVQRRINQCAQSSLPWDVIHIGHHDCHSYLPTWVINQKIVPIIDDKKLFGRFMEDFTQVDWDRTKSSYSIVSSILKTLIFQPRWWGTASLYFIKKIKAHGKDLILSRGRLNKVTFFIQNFMDADALDDERVGACSFMVMTAKGPVSMCEHNANRDDYILEPLKVQNKDGSIDHYEPIKWVQHPAQKKE